MAKNSESRRAWVKNAAIIFLVILLLLTFFSNTILNYSLPEVSAQYPKYSTLTTAVKVDGTIKANASYNVIYEAAQAEAENGTVQSRKVVSVFVREGDNVQKDMPILELQGGASLQLQTVQKEYDDLKRTYDLALLDDAVAALTAEKTLSDAQKAISNEKSALAELQAEYNAVLSGVDTSGILEEKIEKLNEEIEALEEAQIILADKISDIKGKISSAEGMIEEDILSNLTVSEKLALAEEEYAEAEASYQTLTREVEFYKERLEEIKAASGDITEANALTTQLRGLKEQLASLEKSYNRSEEDYLDNLMGYCETICEVFEKLISSLKNEDETDIEENEENESGITIQPSGSERTDDTAVVIQLQETKKNASAVDWSENEIAYINKELEKFYRNSNRYNSVLKLAREYDDNGEIKSILEQIEELDKSYTRSAEDALEQIDDLNDQITEIEDKLRILGMPEVDNVLNYATDYDLAQAQKDYDTASAGLSEVTERYKTAKTNVESLRKQSTAESAAAEYRVLLETYETEEESVDAQLKQKNKDLSALKKEQDGITAPRDPETVADQIKEKQDSIASMEAQLKITEATQQKSATQTKLEREDQLAKLGELQAKIESYKNAPETTLVTAPVAGRIVSINFNPGDSVTSGNTVASIEIADRGYICEISMPSEEARKIQVGAPCTIVNNWWYTNIEASVTQIRPDPQSQGKNRIVVIEVKGDVSEGQSVKFSIGDKSQSYDTVLPNSAIREDNDGKFVLVVESKNSPLGTKYTARRMNIEIIASDDTQSAVSGLYGSEFVITNSQIPVSDGQRVRLADNG